MAAVCSLGNLSDGCRIANILSQRDVKMYHCVKDKRIAFPAVASNHVELVSLEQLSPDMNIDALILTSLTANIKAYRGVFNKMKRTFKSAVHLSEIVDIPFYKGKEREVELIKYI